MTAHTQTEIVAAVGRFWDALESEDRDQAREVIVEFIHPECEWIPLVTGVEGGPYRGHDGVLSWIEDLFDAFEVRLSDRDVRPLSDALVVGLFRIELRGHESGVVVDRELGIVWELDEGLVLRGRVHGSQAEALAAAEALQKAEAK